MNGTVRLRPIVDADLPILFAQQWEPEAIAMAAFTPRPLEAYNEHLKKIRLDPTCLIRVVVVDDLVAGNVGSFERGGKHQVGYWYGKEYWGRGIATRALREFLSIIPTRPLHAHVAKRNGASLRVLQKCGFIICGEECLPSPDGEMVEEWILELRAKES